MLETVIHSSLNVNTVKFWILYKNLMGLKYQKCFSSQYNAGVVQVSLDTVLTTVNHCVLL